jgi:hypothetical protein
MAKICGVSVVCQRMEKILASMPEADQMRIFPIEIWPALNKIGINDKMGLDDVPCAHRLDHRPEAVIERKDMGEAAARTKRQDNFSRKTKLRQDIQSSFEQAAERCLVNWCRNDDPVGILDASQKSGERGGLDVTAEERGWVKFARHNVIGLDAVGLQASEDGIGQEDTLG